METQNIKQELLSLEKQYWQAIKDHDYDTAVRLSDDPCIVAGAQGVGRIDRAKFLEMMKASPYTLDHFEIDDGIEVTQLSDDVAVVAYKVREDVTIDGKPLHLEAADTSTWVRRNGRWVCALHTESLAGDPFGRDRKPPPKSESRT